MTTPTPASRSGSLAPLVAVVVLCAVAALLTSTATPGNDGDLPNAWHHYEYLAEGFAQGHTYLSLQPPAGLLSLHDPYDPNGNWPYRLWDASLYHGHYYLYFGPAPAVVMLPWRFLTGHVPPQRLCVGIAAVAGLLALALVIPGIARRHFPALPSWAPALAVAAAFHASWLPVLLRRSAVWELPMATAVAALWWAVASLWRYHDSGGKARWAVAGGLALALLVGSRVTEVFGAGVIGLLFLAPVAGGSWRRPRAGALWALGLLGAGGLALLAYNQERFGRWLEFGQTYQLWGSDERQVRHMALDYVPFNLRVYLLALPAFGPYFPFLHPYWPDELPRGYIATDEVYGLLFMVPVLLAGLAAVGWMRRAEGPALPARLAVAGAASCSVLSLAILSLWAGACSRYLAELVAGWSLVTGVGVLAALDPAQSPRLRRAVVAAALWTVAAVWLASAEFHAYARVGSPLYRAAARLLNIPSDLWARHEGVHYGPVEIEVRLPREAPVGNAILLANGRPSQVNFLMAKRDGAGATRIILAFNEHHVLETPPFAPGTERLTLRVEAPWLYPPEAHPYWDRVADATRLQRHFSIDWGTGRVEADSLHSADAVTLRPVVAEEAVVGPGRPFVVSMRPAASP